MSAATLPGLAPAPKTHSLRVSAAPAWLPAHLAERLMAAGTVRYSLCKGERFALRRKKQMPRSEWAEKNRHIREGVSSLPGRWHNIFAPYLTGIMDASGHPGVEMLILGKTVQVGGTEAAHNIIGYCIDRAPGPVLYVYPDELTAKENANDRIIPMLEDSPTLRRYLSSYGDDTSSLRIKLHHMLIHMGWAGSVMRLGNKPVRYLVLDEIDKYPANKKEADPVSLAEARTTTWRGKRLIIKISTYTTKDGAIAVAMEKEANCRFDYWVRCPYCGHMQLMSFRRIVWTARHKQKLINELAGVVDEELPEEEDVLAEDVLARKTAEYCCENLGCLWSDSDRDRAVRGGEWRERTTGLELKACLALKNPLKVGFHIPSWISYFISLSEVAHAFLKWEESGDIDDFKNFKNRFAGEPWEEQYGERAEDSILALCDTRPRGIVPRPHEFSTPERPRLPVAALLAGVDTQGAYFRYLIRAFAYGDSNESWLVQCGTAKTFDDLAGILWRSVYRNGPVGDPATKEYRVYQAIIDAMGSRTRKVYEFCVANRGRIVPYQGVQRLAVPIDYSMQEYYPDPKGNKVKIPGGLMLYRANTKFFKDDLAAQLTINPNDPGALHLHTNDKNELEIYAKEMCAEVWSSEKSAWINPHERPNHFWDCEVMVQLLAYHLGLRNWPLPDEMEKPANRPQPQRGHQRLSAAERLGALRR